MRIISPRQRSTPYKRRKYMRSSNVLRAFFSYPCYRHMAENVPGILIPERFHAATKRATHLKFDLNRDSTRRRLWSKLVPQSVLENVTVARGTYLRTREISPECLSPLAGRSNDHSLRKSCQDEKLNSRQLYISTDGRRIVSDYYRPGF